MSGFLCFNKLSVPPLLIDECFTYWRVCGNLDQLLDTLRNDAFMPLHYELLNWIHQGFPLGFGVRLIRGGLSLTPTVMRFFPAMCGTAMTPVMYFLARQMFNRRTAFIAATLMTCSAYGLFFSRNAKMYMPAWMFETLMIACFLAWLRTWRRDAWLCWIFTGVAAGGFHAITLLLLPLLPIYFISVGKFARWKVPMLITGLLLIGTAPAIYYGVCNRWTQNSGGILPGVMGEPAADANWQASGLNWIEPADNSIRLPLTALNAYFSGLEWTGLSDLATPTKFLVRFAPAMVALASTTYGLLMLGALPWPRKISDDRPQPGWRGLLWITLWLVLPTYGFFYCRSVTQFDSPLQWLQWLYSFIGKSWPEIAVGAIAIAAGLNFFPRAAKLLAIPVLLIAVAAIIQSARNRFDWMIYLDRPPIRIAICILIPSLMFHYAGKNFRQRGQQLLRLLAVLATVLLLCEGAALMWRWLHALSMRKHPELPWQSVWHIRYVAIVLPAVWLGAAALIARLPARYLQIAVVLMICSYNLANGLAREYVQTEVPLDRAMADMFLAQPHSNVRTYFNLRTVTDNAYYRPLAAYNACMAAGMTTTPAEFRTGYTWPFQYGRAASDFKNLCVYNPSISSKQLRHDVTANPQVNRVIVWEVTGRFSSVDDSITSALGPRWFLSSDEQISAHWYFTWYKQWIFRRREFRQK